MLDKLKGFKTYTSAAIVGIVAVLQFLGIVNADTAKLLFELAGALGLYGLRDALPK